MTNYTPDQREAARPSYAESFLLEAHRQRVAVLQTTMALMIGKHLAIEVIEEAE